MTIRKTIRFYKGEEKILKAFDKKYKKDKRFQVHNKYNQTLAIKTIMAEASSI